MSITQQRINTLETVEKYTTPERYAARYISRVISETKIEAPELNKAGEHMELLQNLHNGHLEGGPAIASKVWQSLQKFFPALNSAVKYPDRALIHADQLHTLPKPTYELDEYPLYSAGLNVIVGESGSGKSFLALDFGAKVAQTEGVIYIVGEGLYGYAARWEVWKAHHNANPQTSKLWFYPKELDFSDMNELAMFVDMVSEHRPRLVIVDTVARCLGQLDENATKDMGLFIKRTSYLREQLGCGVLCVHHTGKNGIMRGSSALYSAADGVLFVTKTDEVMSIFNDRDRGGKNKDGKPWDPMHRQMVPKTVVNGDDEFESIVLVPTDMIEYDLDDEDQLTEKQRLIVETLESLGGCSATELIDSTNLPRRTIYRNLKQLIRKEMITKNNEIYELVP